MGLRLTARQTVNLEMQLAVEDFGFLCKERQELEQLVKYPPLVETEGKVHL